MGKTYRAERTTSKSKVPHKRDKRVVIPMDDTDLSLWDADPNCIHQEVLSPGGGVRCSKCGGWFCF